MFKIGREIGSYSVGANRKTFKFCTTQDGEHIIENTEVQSPKDGKWYTQQVWGKCPKCKTNYKCPTCNIQIVAHRNNMIQVAHIDEQIAILQKAKAMIVGGETEPQVDGSGEGDNPF